MVTFCRGKEWNEFRKTGGATLDIVQQPPEVGQGVVDSPGECDARLDFRGEGQLHVTEEVTCAREGKGHGPEFPQDLVPPLDACALLVRRDAVQDLCQVLYLMSRKGDCH